MTEYLSGNPGVHFKQYSVVDHTGALVGGHYFTFFRKLDENGDEKWFCANDSSVYEVNVREVLSTSKAYLLYYEQQPANYNPEPEPAALMMMDADVG